MGLADLPRSPEGTLARDIVWSQLRGMLGKQTKDTHSLWSECGIPVQSGGKYRGNRQMKDIAPSRPHC